MLISQQGNVRTLTFNRPAARNAIDAATADGLVAALQAAAQDGDTHCVVLASGHPDVFLSGGDLRELQALLPAADAAEQVTTRGRLLSYVEQSPLPVIAAVQGATFGGGCELLLMCDVVVMEHGATLRFVHGKMGLTPAWGGSTRLLERVGPGNAADLLFRAATLDAERALQIGLAQHLAEAGEGLQLARKLAAQMAVLGKDALIALKRSLLAAKNARRGAGLADESEVFAEAWASGRVHQAVAAFFRR